MTSPIAEILVRCRRCRRLYRDWYRASVNPQLDPELAADARYLDATSTATCAYCGEKTAIGDLRKERDFWSTADPGGFPDRRAVGAEPTRRLRVVSLNLRATPPRRATALAPLIALLGEQQPDVVLLQECRKGWTELVCQELGLEGVSTHELLEDTVGLPADGCAIAARPPLRMIVARPIEPRMFMPASIEALIGAETPPGYEQLPEELLVRFRARSLIARITDGLHEFAAGSFHATAGTRPVRSQARPDRPPLEALLRRRHRGSSCALERPVSVRNRRQRAAIRDAPQASRSTEMAGQALGS